MEDTMDRIGEAIAGARRYLGEHPAEARYTDSLATARIVDGLRCEVSGPNGERLETDMPDGVGGGGAAPGPGWLLRAATASCVASLVAMRAAELQVGLSTVEVDVDSESDDRGILGIDDEVPAGPLSTRISVRLRPAESSDAEKVTEIGRWAVDHCPVADALRRPVPVTIDVTLG
jgi:uncharacterized OsmC-like protein